MNCLAHRVLDSNTQRNWIAIFTMESLKGTGHLLINVINLFMNAFCLKHHIEIDGISKSTRQQKERDQAHPQRKTHTGSGAVRKASFYFSHFQNFKDLTQCN